MRFPRLSDYINPYVGSIGHLLTSTRPICALPHGMMQISPSFSPKIKDAYLSDKIWGFPLGPVNVMPCGREVLSPAEAPSRFDHDLETARAYCYRVWLENTDTTVSYTVGRHSGIAQVISENAGEHYLLLTAFGGSDICVHGRRITLKGTYQQAPAYAVYEFSEDFTYEKISGAAATKKGEAGYSGVKITYRAETMEIRFAVSLIDLAQAEDNFTREVENRSFEALCESAAAEWDTLLSQIRLTGGTESEKTTFYTAMYRVFLRQIDFSEYGRHYSGFDKAIHPDNGHEFYSNDGVWDTHRGAHPLQLLLSPSVHADILESFIRAYEQSGWLHDFPNQAGGAACMLGSHTTTLFANALVHGIPFDAVRAYKAVRYAHFEGSLIPWHIGPATALDRCYFEKGFFPALQPGEEETIPEVHSFERRQAVAVTLEQAYDDCCAAVLAAKAGKPEDAETLKKRADNYKKVFDPEIKFMAPRDINGEFIRPFDPKLGYAQGGRDYYAECNAWVYTMEVRHDVAGLIGLFGSKEAFEKRLDDTFTEPQDMPLYRWLALFPDSTGLMGQFCMGNEPAFHIPYLYNYTGSPWKTQKLLHDITKIWFSNHPLGICGDEDGGAMSAWFVFTAIGFYPFCPGSGVYLIGSPLFDSATITLGNGRTFIVSAPGASAGRKYIKSARLNGTEWNKAWFSAQDLLSGGVLELEMSDKPCKTWASGEDATPPSMASML